MSAQPTVRVLGELMVDVIARTRGGPAPGSDSHAEITDEDGGSAANVAAWLAHLGVPAQLIARAGSDARADDALARLSRSGVDLRVARDPALPTGRCVVVVAPDGERTMFPDPGANAHLASTDFDPDEWGPHDHLHVSGYSLLREGSRPAALAALEAARSLDLTVSVDASSEAPILDLGPRTFMEWLRPGDLLFANAPEACALSGEADPHQALLELARHGVSVIVKRGAQGAIAARGGEYWQADAEPAEVLDSTGAGDAFAAGFLATWTRGADIGDALEHATRVAARAVSRRGGRP